MTDKAVILIRLTGVRPNKHVIATAHSYALPVNSAGVVEADVSCGCGQRTKIFGSFSKEDTAKSAV